MHAPSASQLRPVATSCLQSGHLSRAVHRSPGPGHLLGHGRADSVPHLKATAKHLRPPHAVLCASPAGPRRGAARSVTALRSSSHALRAVHSGLPGAGPLRPQWQLVQIAPICPRTAAQIPKNLRLTDANGLEYARRMLQSQQLLQSLLLAPASTRLRPAWPSKHCVRPARRVMRARAALGEASAGVTDIFRQFRV